MPWNIEGVNSEVYGNKFEDDGFLSIIQNYDIIGFTETHAGDEIKLDIPGYVVKRKTRPKSRRAKKFSGGIAVAIRLELAPYVELIDSKSDNIVWVNIKQSKCEKGFLIGIVYISPINSTYTKNVLSDPFSICEF